MKQNKYSLYSLILLGVICIFITLFLTTLANSMGIINYHDNYNYITINNTRGIGIELLVKCKQKNTGWTFEEWQSIYPYKQLDIKVDRKYNICEIWTNKLIYQSK
jgi:hypothetical protein